MSQKTKRCETQYPLFLIHGAGFRDRSYLNYWGRIPKKLKKEGCQVYYGHQDSWATIENNSLIIKKNIEKVLAETGAEKVNIIAHSKGGLESRYIASSLHMANHIASITTMATPHHGSKTMDLVCRLPKLWFRIVSLFANLWFRILGDKDPDFHNVCGQLTRAYTKTFNQENPDAKEVYYQSYTALMKTPLSDIFLLIPYIVVYLIEGKSDGLVTLESAKWGHFRGVIEGPGLRGISHADEVDIRRSPLTRRKASGCVRDICGIYCDIVAELKEMGY